MLENLTIQRFSLNAWLIQGKIELFFIKHESVFRKSREFGLALQDIVWGDNCVLLKFAEAISREKLESLLSELNPCELTESLYSFHEIPVSYNGIDIDKVAQHMGLAVDDYIQMHSSVVYTVDFMGFAPGFAYLKGGDMANFPRISSPRKKIEAGSLAVAAGYTAVYPVSSPGGWNIIGKTDQVFFDPKLSQPAKLRPLDRVKFVPI